MIDFCIHLFEPTREEMHKAVAQKYTPDLLALHGPIMGEKEVNATVEATDEDAKMVLSRMNALKILRNDTSCDSFGTDAVNGYVVQLERGKLGLVPADDSAPLPVLVKQPDRPIRSQNNAPLLVKILTYSCSFALLTYGVVQMSRHT